MTMTDEPTAQLPADTWADRVGDANVCPDCETTVSPDDSYCPNEECPSNDETLPRCRICGKPDRDLIDNDDYCEPCAAAKAQERARERAIDTTGDTVEVLPAVRESSPGTAAAHAAIEQAARAALEQPGIPGRDEFLSLAMQARMMAGSGLVPDKLQGKPADVFLILLTGRDLGIPVTAALRKVYVVDGQPSLAPQLKLALVRRQGLGLVRPVPGGNAAWQASEAIGPDGEPLGPPITVMWDDYRGDLVGVDCVPSEDGERIEHSDACKARPQQPYTNGVRVRCKDNWRNHPRRMLRWRSSGYCADDYFPEVGLGLYSPDELGAVTDEEGRPIDARTVDLPEGFEQAEARTAAAARQAGGSTGNAAPTVDPADVDDLYLRVEALPESHRLLLRQTWDNSDRVKGQSMRQAAAAGELQFIRAMIRGFEIKAAKDVEGWDADAARAEVAMQRQAAREGSTTTSGDAAPGGDGGDGEGGGAAVGVGPSGGSPPPSPSEGAGSPQEAPATPDAPSPAPETPDAPQGHTEADAGEPAPERPKLDPREAAPVAEQLREAIDATDPATAERIAGEVKAMHHAKVNDALKVRGYDPDGVHIDVRRMVLTHALLVAELLPFECWAIGCGEPGEEDARPEPDHVEGVWCGQHIPF